MKPEHQNNFSQKSQTTSDSNNDNNSSSSDSEMEFVGTSAQGKLKSKRKDERQISELKRKLAVAEINLRAQKEQGILLENSVKDKDDFIKNLQLSIDLVTEKKDMAIQKLQIHIIDLQSALDLSRIAIKDNDRGECVPARSNDKFINTNKELNTNNAKLKEKNDQIVELDAKTRNYEEILKEKETEIARLEFKVDESKLQIVKLEGKIQEKDEKLVKMREILSEYTGNTNDTDEFVCLSSSKIPSIKLVTPPDCEPFAAVFEDIPSAGRGWMVIQRRIDGSFDDGIVSKLRTGCGDLNGEFWIGLQKLHKMTINQRLELYIDLVDFDNISAYARYDNFVIGGSNEGYKLLSLGKYSGNAGDAFRNHINECVYVSNPFISSHWKQSKWWGEGNCNLNGIYRPSKVVLDTSDGIWWGSYNIGKRYSLKSCKMLIRAVVNLK